MLIAYLLHPSLFNLLTDHFLFRAQQQIHFLSPVNLFTIWANAIGATLPPPENSASLHIKKKKKEKKVLNPRKDKVTSLRTYNCMKPAMPHMNVIPVG